MRDQEHYYAARSSTSREETDPSALNDIDHGQPDGKPFSAELSVCFWLPQGNAIRPDSRHRPISRAIQPGPLNEGLVFH